MELLGLLLEQESAIGAAVTNGATGFAIGAGVTGGLEEVATGATATKGVAWVLDGLSEGLVDVVAFISY